MHHIEDVRVIGKMLNFSVDDHFHRVRLLLTSGLNGLRGITQDRLTLVLLVAETLVKCMRIFETQMADYLKAPVISLS